MARKFRPATESERLNAREYLTGLRDLLDRYTLPLAGKVRDFWNRAIASARQAYGLFATTGRNLVQPGDILSLWVDPRTGHAQRITVSSTLRGRAGDAHRHVRDASQRTPPPRLRRGDRAGEADQRAGPELQLRPEQLKALQVAHQPPTRLLRESGSERLDRARRSG